MAKAKKLLRLIGDNAFGPPDEPRASVIEWINDLARLEGLLPRVKTAGGCSELLGPAPGRLTQ